MDKCELVLTEVGDESILYDSSGGRVHVLNKTAAFLFNQLKEGKTPQQAAEEMCRVFEADEKTALQDTLEFIEEFKKLGLSI